MLFVAVFTYARNRRTKTPPRGGVFARYVAELHEIKQRYAKWEITGPAEIREVSSDARYFTPHRRETRLGNLGPVLTIAGWKPGRRVTVAGIAS